MSPRLTFNNALDCHEADAVFLRQRAIANTSPSVFVALAYLVNVLFRKFGRSSRLSAQYRFRMGTHPVSVTKGISIGPSISPMFQPGWHSFWVSPASMSVALSRTSFRVSICRVLNVGSLKQMCRVAARRIVAVVTNVQRSWVNFIKQKVGNPMREQLVFFPIKRGRPMAVSISVTPSLPRPTFSRAQVSNFGLESLNLLPREMWKNIIQVSHDLSLIDRLGLWSGPPGCSSTRAGRFAL